MRGLLIVTAALELGAGVALIALPSGTVALLLGSPLDSRPSLVLGRLAGTALLTLGIASWLIRFNTSSLAARGFVAGMVVYNLGAVAILAVAAVQLQPARALLWFVVVLHAAMAAWCCVCLLKVDRGQLSPEQ